MTPDQIAIFIVNVVIAIGAAAGTARVVAKPQNVEVKLAEANARLLLMVDEIKDLRQRIIDQIKTIADLNAKYNVSETERERERTRYEARNDALMIEQGKRDKQIEVMQKSIDDLRAALVAANAEIKQLKDELRTAKEKPAAALPKASGE